MGGFFEGGLALSLSLSLSLSLALSLSLLSLFLSHSPRHSESASVLCANRTKNEMTGKGMRQLLSLAPRRVGFFFSSAEKPFVRVPGKFTAEEAAVLIDSLPA